MQMAAGAGQVGVELRHECGGHAMPKSDLLHGGLKQRGFVGGGERFINTMAPVYPGPVSVDEIPQN